MCAAGSRRSAGSSALVMLTVPQRLTSMSQRISSIVSWSMSPSIEEPAHVMSDCTWGWDASISAASANTASSSVRSTTCVVWPVPVSVGDERGEAVRVAVEEREPRAAPVELARDLGAHAARGARDDAGPVRARRAAASSPSSSFPSFRGVAVDSRRLARVRPPGTLVWEEVHGWGRPPTRSPRASRSPRPRLVSRCATTSSSRRSRTTSRSTSTASRRSRSETLIALADEQEAAADLVRRQRKKAWGKFSDSHGTHDYRDRDMRNLRKPAAAVPRRREGAARPRGRPRGGRASSSSEARDAAWGDVEANLLRRLRVEGMRAEYDPDYDDDARRADAVAAARRPAAPRAHRRQLKNAADSRPGHS